MLTCIGHILPSVLCGQIVIWQASVMNCQLLKGLVDLDISSSSWMKEHSLYQLDHV